MKWVLIGLGIWGVVDGLWLTLSPRSWSERWGSYLDLVGNRRVLATVTALAEIVLSLALIRAGRRRGQGSGYAMF